MGDEWRGKAKQAQGLQGSESATTLSSSEGLPRILLGFILTGCAHPTAPARLRISPAVQKHPASVGVRRIPDPPPHTHTSGSWGPSLSSHLARSSQVFICSFPRRGSASRTPKAGAPADAPGPQASTAKSPLGCPQASPASRPGRA